MTLTAGIRNTRRQRKSDRTVLDRAENSNHYLGPGGAVGPPEGPGLGDEDHAQNHMCI